MHIQLSRVIALPITTEVLHELLTGWSVCAGFAEVSALPDRWVFRRGSAWLAPWTFDIRKVPTEVTAVHLPISGQVAISLVCSSMWQIATPWDRARLENDFDQLWAFLFAAPGQDRDRVGEEIRQRWQGTRKESITREESGLREDRR
jgi:hypothetical protein